MKQELAIIIPAYKQEFLKATLQSIANQTCKDFVLYIGDDASPEDLFTIADAYKDAINIVYKRFDKNLGGTNLVAHWERCVDLSKDEEWIWMFSDDDVMAPNCVEQFYSCKNKTLGANLFHFNLDIINQHGAITKECALFPEHMLVTDFFKKRVAFKINSSVVEYIFKRSVYNAEGRFKNNDLAWCADDATWIKFGRNAGITTINGAKVQWRYSGSNISSNLKDKEIVLRKLEASTAHIKWVRGYFREHGLADNSTAFEKFKWVISIVVLTPALSLKEKHALVLKVINDLNYQKIRSKALGYLFYWQVKRLIKN